MSPRTMSERGSHFFLIPSSLAESSMGKRTYIKKEKKSKRGIQRKDFAERNELTRTLRLHFCWLLQFSLFSAKYPAVAWLPLYFFYKTISQYKLRPGFPRLFRGVRWNGGGKIEKNESISGTYFLSRSFQHWPTATSAQSWMLSQSPYKLPLRRIARLMFVSTPEISLQSINASVSSHERGAKTDYRTCCRKGITCNCSSLRCSATLKIITIHSLLH